MKKTFILFLAAIFFVAESSAQCWKKISTGGHHSAAIAEDGTLWTWGFNSYGQLGDGTMTDKAMPTKLGTETNWDTVAVGYDFTLALKTDGTLWAWGTNSARNLGVITTGTIQKIPINVSNDKSWRVISASDRFAMAIKNDGTLWAWGINDNAQLGISSLTTSGIPYPTQIGTSKDWSAVSLGAEHSMLLKTDGTLWLCGINTYGQLGATPIANERALAQLGTETNWKAISAGQEHSLALKKDGTIWAWGRNQYGQLANGSVAAKLSPIQVGVDTDWKIVRAAYYHSSAVKTDGTLWYWGNNSKGETGSVNQITPVQVGDDTWRNISSRGGHTIGIKTDGTIAGWGNNEYSQLGVARSTFEKEIVQVEESGCPILTADLASIDLLAISAIYPNPAKNFIRVKDAFEGRTYRIVNAQGQVVRTGLVERDMNIEELPQGIYTFQCAETTERLIKE